MHSLMLRDDAISPWSKLNTVACHLMMRICVQDVYTKGESR